MSRLVYLLVLFVMFITSAKAEIFYSTLKIGEQTTLNAYASPSSIIISASMNGGFLQFV